MGGGIGPPKGPPKRGTPENGGGPLGAMLTLPSSMTFAGEELLELLFITGAGPGSEAECFPDASDGHRGQGKCLSNDPHSLLGMSP